MNHPNRELVVYVLGLLGGESKRIHTEDIALKCHELFPDSFSWTKYPEIPDKDIVRVALTDARKVQYGSLVEGRSGQKYGHSSKSKRAPAVDGWILTSDGIKWFRENAYTLAGINESRELNKHRQQIHVQLNRVKIHPLYQRFLQDGRDFSPSLGEIAEILKCRVDADSLVWRKRFNNLRGKALAVEDNKMLVFVEVCESVIYTHGEV